ncbi:MAG: RNA polymerase sigma factor [Planctomycetes bacterium]|nr:RNA polymerase sigma factor [Planctomycetota bacterium]
MSDPLADAFLRHCEEHRGIPARVAFAWCRSASDRQDLEQEILLHAWRAFSRFDGHGRYSTWLYRIALNVAISWRRREQVRRRHVVPDLPPEPVDRRAEHAAEQRELAEPLRAAIDALDDASRALLLLHLDGHEHGEIAAILGISTSNVGTRLHRLKELLKQQLR